jgi:8-oxo-dGTP pyrophosphatase MutT (NUDIX family)
LHQRLGDNLIRFVEPMLRRPAHVQAAALCVRPKGKRQEVLLITSRGTGRWILPKGWPMKDRSLADAAAQEAWEEAGVRGVVGAEAIGKYTARKITETGLELRCAVHVFRLDVSELVQEFPEAGQRKRKWVSPAKAATLVQEEGLRDILRAL